MVQDHRATCRQARRVGLIGGMSWRSTALYYERLNRAIERKLGAHNSFAGQVWNLNYADVLAMASVGDGAGIETMLTQAARGLARADCSVVALTAVTAHRWHEAVQAAAAIDVPHVLQGAARHLDVLDIGTAGVLGTAMTCESDFVRHYLHGEKRQLLFLATDEQAEIDHLIQGILTAGLDLASGGRVLSKATERLRARGAKAIVLACTELPLLLPTAEADVPLIDCVAFHVDQICNQILSETNVQ